VLSGAGLSAESGLQTFRGADGLWEGHRFEDVATPEAWARNPDLVLRFYNMRRQAVRAARPNAAHQAIADLETFLDVTVITQNVDDLHERAGSSHIIHLHGELLYARGSKNPAERIHLGDNDIQLGDCCPKGTQLRPDIVWFGEEVTQMPRAAAIAGTADIFIVVGTSLSVYPAASLMHYVPESAQKWIIDPSIPAGAMEMGLKTIPKPATEGMAELMEMLSPKPS
jgi:NAD-dependent deacetylase